MSTHHGHGHGHAHGHGSAQPDAGPGGTRALAVTLALVCTVLAAEVIGGLVSGSLALLSDAAHATTASRSWPRC